MISGSLSTTNRAGWRLPPLGALTAASRISRKSSVGIESGRKRRIERWLNIASPIGMFNRWASCCMCGRLHRQDAARSRAWLLDALAACVAHQAKHGVGHQHADQQIYLASAKELGRAGD